MLSIEPTVFFSKNDYYNWVCFPSFEGGKGECIDSFRENPDYLFSSKSIEWHLREPIDHWRIQLKFFAAATKLLNIF